MEKIKKFFRFVFTKHTWVCDWKEVAWDGPITVCECTKCPNEKIIDYFNSTTTFYYHKPYNTKDGNTKTKGQKEKNS